jgi:hypothetical protein
MPGSERDEFGKRRPLPLQVSPPVKRSHKVALLLMGTVAVGGGAYTLMPRQNCDTEQSATATEPSEECRSGRSSSSSHGGSGGSSQRAYGGSEGSDSGTSHTTRGGFGSFAHSFAMHFSGGG